MATTTTLRTPSVPERDIGSEVFQIAPDEFRREFNKSSFTFPHTLAGHPAFTMERLEKLLEMTVSHPELLYWDAGEKRIDQRWNEKPGRDFSVQEAFRRIRECGAWIILFSAERDPEIARILEQSMQQVQELSGYNLFDEVKVRSAYIFITAPHRVTSYHIDFQCNFLLQLHGEKTIHVFDQNDRELLTEEELERFWTNDTNAAVYKPELQNRAHTVVMKPGMGVHLPVNAPHWLKNGDDISVSLSLNFQFKNAKYANIYRANYFLRKMGMNPAPPGRSKTFDLLKGHGMDLPVESMKLLKKLKGETGSRT